MYAETSRGVGNIVHSQHMAVGRHDLGRGSSPIHPQAHSLLPAGQQQYLFAGAERANGFEGPAIHRGFDSVEQKAPNGLPHTFKSWPPQAIPQSQTHLEFSVDHAPQENLLLSFP